MQRARKQDGYIFKAKGKWYLRYFVTRVIDGEARRVRVAKPLIAIVQVDEVKGSQNDHH